LKDAAARSFGFGMPPLPPVNQPIKPRRASPALTSAIGRGDLGAVDQPASRQPTVIAQADEGMVAVLPGAKKSRALASPA
jgi:hypothetical protein